MCHSGRGMEAHPQYAKSVAIFNSKNSSMNMQSSARDEGSGNIEDKEYSVQMEQMMWPVRCT